MVYISLPISFCTTLFEQHTLTSWIHLQDHCQWYWEKALPFSLEKDRAAIVVIYLDQIRKKNPKPTWFKRAFWFDAIAKSEFFFWNSCFFKNASYLLILSHQYFRNWSINLKLLTSLLFHLETGYYLSLPTGISDPESWTALIFIFICKYLHCITLLILEDENSC